MFCHTFFFFDSGYTMSLHEAACRVGRSTPAGTAFLSSAVLSRCPAPGCICVILFILAVQESSLLCQADKPLLYPCEKRPSHQTAHFAYWQTDRSRT